MSTQKAKFELFARLQSLGFTYDEAYSLRRIEMTLQRWAEKECGDGIKLPERKLTSAGKIKAGICDSLPAPQKAVCALVMKP